MSTVEKLREFWRWRWPFIGTPAGVTEQGGKNHG